jgi:hypothetical protein
MVLSDRIGEAKKIKTPPERSGGVFLCADPRKNAALHFVEFHGETVRVWLFRLDDIV